MLCDPPFYFWWNMLLYYISMWLLCMWVLSHFWLFVTPWTVACQAPLSIGFSRQDSDWHFFPPGDLPNPAIKPTSLCLLHCRWILHPWAIITLMLFNTSLSRINYLFFFFVMKTFQISFFINFEVLSIMIAILCIRYPHVRMNHQENRRLRVLVRVWRNKNLVHC